MKDNYARHKKFVKDVVRAVDPDEISEIVAHFVPLRASSYMQDLSDEQILNVVKMITKTDLDEVYPFLYKDGLGLSDHQIIFRIKRVKYIKTEKDSMSFNITHPISELGRSIGTTFINTLDIMNMKVRKMPEQDVEKIEEKEKIDMQKVLDFALKNVKWTGRDGHFNEGPMTAQEAESVLEKEFGIKMSALKIRGVLRNYYKDKPIPPKPVKEEVKEESSKNDDSE